MFITSLAWRKTETDDVCEDPQYHVILNKQVETICIHVHVIYWVSSTADDLGFICERHVLCVKLGYSCVSEDAKFNDHFMNCRGPYTVKS